MKGMLKEWQRARKTMGKSHKPSEAKITKTLKIGVRFRKMRREWVRERSLESSESGFNREEMSEAKCPSA